MGRSPRQRKVKIDLIAVHRLFQLEAKLEETSRPYWDPYRRFVGARVDLSHDLANEHTVKDRDRIRRLRGCDMILAWGNGKDEHFHRTASCCKHLLGVFPRVLPALSQLARDSHNPEWTKAWECSRRLWELLRCARAEAGSRTEWRTEYVPESPGLPPGQMGFVERRPWKKVERPPEDKQTSEIWAYLRASERFFTEPPRPDPSRWMQFVAEALPKGQHDTPGAKPVSDHIGPGPGEVVDGVQGEIASPVPELVSAPAKVAVTATASETSDSGLRGESLDDAAASLKLKHADWTRADIIRALRVPKQRIYELSKDESSSLGRAEKLVEGEREDRRKRLADLARRAEFQEGERDE